MSPDDELLSDRALAIGLLESAADAIVIVRADGTIAAANRMAERLFGFDRSELVGRPIEMLVPMPKRGEHVGLRSRYATSGRARLMGELSPVDALRKNGETVPVEISLSPVETEIGRLTIAIVRDVRRRRELEERLRFASTHDAMTGLFNRAHFDQIRPGLERESLPVGVILADIDGLKAVNDRAGHDHGDQLIRRCAIVLRAACGDAGIVARLGGDEFAVLMPRATAASVDATLARIREELAHHNDLTREVALSISLGTALADRSTGISHAMRLADRRMYEDKRRRGSGRPVRG